MRTAILLILAVARLSDFAPRGAIDCGVARDAATSARVYDCGANALREHEAFYAQYDTVAYVGTRGGLVYQLRQRRPGGEYVREATPSQQPMRLQPGMHPPVPRAPESVDVGTKISGVVIVEARFDDKGNVLETRVVKPLPFRIDAACDALVRRTKFAPARLFGVPMAVITNVVVRVTTGKAAIVR